MKANQQRKNSQPSNNPVPAPVGHPSKIMPQAVPVEQDEFEDIEEVEEVSQIQPKPPVMPLQPQMQAVKQVVEQPVSEDTANQEQMEAVFREIEMLQNNGRYRAELLHQLNEINKALVVIAGVLVDFKDGKA